MNKNILVNATSLASNGGLTILNSYINKLHLEEENDKKYYLFVPDNCQINELKDKIHYIKNSENPFYKNKNYWNLIGMRKWCKKNGLKIHELYSLQNYYPFWMKDKGALKSLYLHQSIPFYDYSWSILKKKERSLWFYKNIYFYLIRKSIKESDKVIVQTEWFKKQIISKLKFDGKKIVVEKPVLNDIDPKKYDTIPDLEGKVKLFYPAGSVVYKNHEILYRAMNILVNEWENKGIVLYLTLDKTDAVAQKYIEMFKLENNIVLTGKLDYEQVMNHYKTVDALVFPSKIETFGLPLVEAQHFGLAIIATDLELYREVIGEYQGKVTYCKCDDAKEWVAAIKDLII